MEETSVKEGRVQYVLRLARLFVRLVADSIVRAAVDTLHAALRAPGLFLGSALFLLGVLNFNVGRYCDGNIGDYLSCTRPAVYYYFDGLDIALIAIGVFMMLAWLVNRKDT
jgi:hypothetical protein